MEGVKEKATKEKTVTVHSIRVKIVEGINVVRLSYVTLSDIVFGSLIILLVIPIHHGSYSRDC